jgi:thioredoxin 1
MHKITIGLFLTLITFMNVSAQISPSTSTLPADKFDNLIKTTKDAIILDVRTQQEFGTGHIEHATNINWNGKQFDSLILKLDKTKPVFIYCLSGGRSAKAAAHMRDIGFKNVSELQGGLMQWRAKNLAETGSTTAQGMTLDKYNGLLNSDKLVLVDFYADWCLPCKEMKPYLDRIAIEKKDEVVVVRIDADLNKELCKKLGVSGLPVLKLYKNKKEIWQQIGFINEQGVQTQLKLSSIH